MESEKGGEKRVFPLLSSRVFTFSIDVVRLLLRNGAERELATSYGVTALQLAKSNGHSECVKLLAPPSPQAVLPPIRPSASAPTTQTRDFARFQADLRYARHDRETNWRIRSIEFRQFFCSKENAVVPESVAMARRISEARHARSAGDDDDDSAAAAAAAAPSLLESDVEIVLVEKRSRRRPVARATAAHGSSEHVDAHARFVDFGSGRASATERETVVSTGNETVSKCARARRSARASLALHVARKRGSGTRVLYIEEFFYDYRFIFFRRGTELTRHSVRIRTRQTDAFHAKGGLTFLNRRHHCPNFRRGIGSEREPR